MTAALLVLVRCSLEMVGSSLRQIPTPHAPASARELLLRSVLASRTFSSNCCEAFTGRATSQPKVKSCESVPTLAQNSVSCDQVSVFADQRAICCLQTVAREQRTSVREWKALNFSRLPRSALLRFHRSAAEGTIAN